MTKFALLLLAAPLALAACGGGSSNAQVKVDPLSYVKHSANKTAGLPSEHMKTALTVSVAGQDISLNGSGDYTTSPPRGAFSMSTSLMGQDVKIDAVQDGTTIYMQSPAFSAQLPAGKTWMKLDLQKAGAANGLNYSSLMSRSPEQALQQLEAAGSVKSLGTETIDGVETTHYQVTNLDLSKMPQGAKIQALVHPKYGPIDVWIGNDDGYVHRESTSFSYSVMGQSASMSMQTDLSKFGEKVNVTVPPPSAVFDASSLAGAGAGLGA
jgi:hypothetical protein